MTSITGDERLIAKFNAVTEHAPLADIERASGFTSATIKGYQSGEPRQLAMAKPHRAKLAAFVKANQHPIETLAQTDGRLIVRALKLVEGMSNVEAADLLGVGEGAVSKWRKGDMPGQRGLFAKVRTKLAAKVSRAAAEGRLYEPGTRKSAGAAMRPSGTTDEAPTPPPAPTPKPEPTRPGMRAVSMTLLELHEALGDQMSTLWIMEGYREGRLNMKTVSAWIEYRNGA